MLRFIRKGSLQRKPEACGAEQEVRLRFYGIVVMAIARVVVASLGALTAFIGG